MAGLLKKNMEHLSETLSKIPVQALYTVTAATGGVARYLNSFKDGKVRFSLSFFVASAFVAGFSGLMFALLGESLNLPSPLPYIMAGVGGFFGDQTMKFLLEYFTQKPLAGGTKPGI